MTEPQQRMYIDHQGELEMVRDADELWVELHWAIVPTYYAPPRSSGGVWLRSVEVPFGRKFVQALSPEDELEALCVHGSKHRWERLVWIADVSMAVKASSGSLDWDALLARARAHGTLRMVRLGLLLADTIGGAQLPERVLADARRMRRPRIWPQTCDGHSSVPLTPVRTTTMTPSTRPSVSMSGCASGGATRLATWSAPCSRRAARTGHAPGCRRASFRSTG